MLKIGHYVPDIIISDLLMPNMDGFQMIRVLSEQNILEKSSIIVITGLSDSEIERRGGLPSEVTVLRKPVDVGVLKELLGNKLSILASNQSVLGLV